MKKSVKKKYNKIKISIQCVLILLVAIVYFVPFDFKYVKLTKGYPSVGISSVKFAERSTTKDDSVCVVLKREGVRQKVIQRVSSNQLVSFKYEISQRKFDFFTTLKRHYYEKKWQGVKLPYENMKKPRDILARTDCLKIQYYDIDKNKLYKEEDILKCLKKFDKNNALYGLDIRHIGVVDEKNLSIYCDKKHIKRNASGFHVYEYVYPAPGRDFEEWKDFENNGYMDKGSFNELLKANGIKTKGINYYFGGDLYGSINLDINTENLPKNNAKLYKVYPGLKKFIGQNDMKVQIHVKGIKNPDKLVEYFFPEGHKITYGKKGIKIGGEYQEKDGEMSAYKGKYCKNFKEYLDIQNKVEHNENN
ncbi:hypothetical protein [Lachnobacterium bovis]|uniref:hypothetical protein n=1 Tax=Lachnobacterium bovis TaxID=140626 RepID=UPI00048F7B30|nr:hypothetical protein [Lachnobacterium bovis]